MKIVFIAQYFAIHTRTVIKENILCEVAKYNYVELLKVEPKQYQDYGYYLKNKILKGKYYA